MHSVKYWMLNTPPISYIVHYDVIVYVNCYNVLVNGNHDNYRWEGYKQWREDRWIIQQIIHSTLTDLTLYDVMTGCHSNNKTLIVMYSLILFKSEVLHCFRNLRNVT